MKNTRALFLVDANQSLGSGHLYECLELAKYLKVRALFCMEENRSARILTERLGFKSVVLAPGYRKSVRSSIKISAVLNQFKPEIIIVDIPKISESELCPFVKFGCPLIVLNAILYPLKAGIQINTVFTPLPANQKFYGTKYILLRQSFKGQKSVRIKPVVKNILVLFGGADPGNLTLKTLKALDGVSGEFRVNVVLGKFFKFSDKIKKFLPKFSKPFQLYTDIKNDARMIRLMKTNDLAMVSGGYTLAELLYFGIPCLVLSQNLIEAERVFPNFPEGAFRYLGRGDEVSLKKLKNAAEKLILNYPARKNLAERARRAVDGKGLERVAKIIGSVLHK